MLALAGGSLALPVLWHFTFLRDMISRAGNGGGDLAVAFSTVALSALLGWSCLARRSSRLGTVFACAFGGAFLGLVNAGTAFALAELVDKGPLEAAKAFLLGLLFGPVFGAPFGLAFGLAFSPLVVTAASIRENGSLDGPDRVLTAAGWWALAAGFVGSVVAAETPYHSPAWALTALGLAAALWGTRRLEARRAFVERVRAGAEPGWALLSRAEVDAAGPLAPAFAPAAGVPLDGALVRLGAPGPAPYRQGGEGAREPVALVSLGKAR